MKCQYTFKGGYDLEMFLKMKVNLSLSISLSLSPSPSCFQDNNRNELVKMSLTQRLYNHVLNIIQESRHYDERLSAPMVTSSVSSQLIVFADGLLEYTEERLQGLPPTDSAVPVPFNLLSAKILDVDIFQCGHLCWLVVEGYIELIPFLEDLVWIPLQYIAMVLPAVLYPVRNAHERGLCRIHVLYFVSGIYSGSGS